MPSKKIIPIIIFILAPLFFAMGILAQVVTDTDIVDTPNININVKDNEVITFEVSHEILQNQHIDSLPFEALILPKDCFTNRHRLKEDIANETLCEGSHMFTITDFGTYDFSPLRESYIIIYTCKDSINGCDNNPQKIKIGLFSKKTYKDLDNQKGRVNIKDIQQ